MGKRELVLVALFVVVGIVVYNLTAPPPPPGSEGVSFGGIVSKLRREVRGSREEAAASSRQSLPVSAAVRLIRVNIPRNAVTITGGDAAEIAVDMQVTARGFDQAEGEAAAAAARIKLEPAGDAIAVTTSWPTRDNREAGFINEATITITVPRRLLVRLEPHSGRLAISDVGGVEVIGSRGDTKIVRASGHVVVGHTAGRLEIEAVPSLKLTARNSDGTIKGIAGTVSIEATGAELELGDIAGPLDIEARNAEIALDAAKLAKPPFRFNGTGGQLRVSNLQTEGRIDGRNVELDVELTAAAPVTIYSTGEDIRVSAPPGGYVLDAVATEGQITSEDSTITATPGDGPDARVTAPIRGGGPPLTLRATRARIEVRKPAGK